MDSPIVVGTAFRCEAVHWCRTGLIFMAPWELRSVGIADSHFSARQTMVKYRPLPWNIYEDSHMGSWLSEWVTPGRWSPACQPGWSTDFSMEFLYRNKTIWLGNSIENSLGNSISVLYMDLYTISGESAENQHRTDRTWNFKGRWVGWVPLLIIVSGEIVLMTSMGMAPNQ